MTTKRRGRAPNPEWVLMYRKGLTGDRIANLVDAAKSTVGYHLRIARTLDPGLKAEHEAALETKPTHFTTHGLERTRQLVSLVQETGQYPSRQSPSETERTLAAWLQRRRQDARAATLVQEYRDGLAALPGWETPSRADADEARWQRRLAALVAYRDAGSDWPRHKAVTIGEEHDLGVWLHYQRFRARRGELAAGKVDALNIAVPGWRTGRPRGRKSQPQLSRGTPPDD